MENQILEVLEEKITHILSLVDKLKAENLELKQRNQQLQVLVDEKEKTIQTLRQESVQYRDAQNEIESYREKQDHIRSKVETLLQKLKEFEDIQ